MSELAVFNSQQGTEASELLNAAVLTGEKAASDPSVSVSVSALQAKLENVARFETDLADGRSLRKAFSGSDAFIVVNPVFSSEAKLARLAHLSLRARIAGKPVALVGLSVSGLSTRPSRKLASLIVRNADLVLMRDELSADALMEAGVEPPFRLGADPAWAQLDELYAANQPTNQLVVAIDLTDDQSRTSRLEDTLSKTLGPLVNSGIEVLLQPWGPAQGGVDNTLVAKKVSARLGGNATIVDPPQSLRDARELYSGSRMVLATRRHALMAAAVAGSRAVSFSDSDDIQRFSKQLAVPSVSINAEPRAMSEALLGALESEPTPPVKVREQIDRAKGSLSLVRLLLTGGAEQEAAALETLPLYPNPWRS